MRDPILYEFENAIYAQGRDLAEDDIVTYPLFSDEDLAGILAELHGILGRDREQARPGLLSGPVPDGIRDYAKQWFQRIDFPALGLSTTSDREWAVFDEGGVNTLGRRLTSEEACLLRPWPKWMYVRPLLPDLRGKSVLEVGSANGFFPFRFAELGASHVTGLDVQRRKVESAVWANSILGWDNVTFRQTDFLVDFSIQQHDIVFVSEVVNHTVCPMWSIARLVSLARECLIIDTGVFETPQHGMELSTLWSRDGKRLRMINFQISDGLVISYLKVLGLRSSEIVRYVEPGAGHNLYKIDVRGLQARRAAGDMDEVPENQRRSLLMDLTVA